MNMNNNDAENIGISEQMARSKAFNDILESHGIWGENLSNEQIVMEFDALRESGKEIPVTPEEMSVREKWAHGGMPERNQSFKKEPEAPYKLEVSHLRDVENPSEKLYTDEERQKIITFLGNRDIPNLESLSDKELKNYYTNITHSININKDAA